jgi:uncharacterized protein (UPF0335 family)
MKHTLTEAIARIETLEAAAEKSAAITAEPLQRTSKLLTAAEEKARAIEELKQRAFHLHNEAERRAQITAGIETRLERLEASKREIEGDIRDLERKAGKC